MIPWGVAGAFLWGYNAWASRRGRGTACSNVRSLKEEDRALAFLVWVWFGVHLFVKRERG